MPLFLEAFEMVDTHGLPLAIVMQKCSEEGLPVDIDRFIADAQKAGWTREKAISVANEAVNMLHGEQVQFAMRR